MKKSFILVITITVITSSLRAQDNIIPTRYSNPLTQAPNVESLGKYGDIPVGHYTGIPKIDIPLYTIKIKDYELPFSISYHASGIKVAEEASFIGLGWAFNGGGVIAQIVNDRNDMEDFGYLNIDMPDPGKSGDTYSEEYPSIDCSTKIEYTGVSTDFDHRTVKINCEEVVHSDQFSFDESDTEPDFFMFNFGNYSGKFFWDKGSESWQTIERTKLRISYLGIENGWKVISPDGTVYYFHQREQYFTCSSSIGVNPSGSSGPNYNNYYLSKIVLTSKEEINFSYLIGETICNLASYSEVYDQLDQRWCSACWIAPGDITVCPPPEMFGKHRSISGSSYTPSYLDAISFPSGYIKFTWGSRIDLSNAKRLSKVEIFNKFDELPIKTITFDNEHYFQGVNSSNSGFVQYPCYNQSCEANQKDVLYKRLKLESLSISGKDNPYRFDYYEDISLPAKTSFAQDYWGYFNGNLNATTLLPDLQKFYEIVPMEYQLFYFGQDRRSNDNTKAWVLNKITYPTQGYTHFEYELNSFSNYVIPSDLDREEKTMEVMQTYYGSQEDGISVVGNDHGSFTIDNAQTVNITHRFDARITDNPFLTTNFVAQILDENNNVVWEAKLKYGEVSPPEGEDCNKANSNSILTLSPGTYLAKVFREGNAKLCVEAGHTYSSSLFLQVDYTTTILDNNYSYYSRGAGLRIKSIVNNDGSGNQLKRTFIYDYSKEENENKYYYSYGKIMDLPKFYRKYDFYKWSSFSALDNGIACSLDKYEIYGVPIRGLAVTPKGNYVGYNKVIEVLGDQDKNNGYIVYSFQNEEYYCNTESIAPCKNKPSNGLVQSVHYFGAEGQLIKKDSLTYYYADKINSYGIKPEKASFGHEPNTYNIHSYPIYGFRNNIKSRKTEFYDSKNDVWRSELIKYEYNNSHLITKEMDYNSDGSIIEKSFKYPVDYTDEPYTSMASVENHMLNTIIEKTVTNNSPSLNEVYHQRNSYFEPIQGTFLLDKIENSFGGADKEVFKVLAYDSFNNPISTIGRNGIITSYLYDYTGQFTTAKIINASLDEVYYEGFESPTFTATSGAKAGMGYNTSSTFNILFAAPNEEQYVLEYWFLNEGKWEYRKMDYTGSVTLTNGPFDEIRVYPKDAQITTYTYKPLVGISSVFDANGLFKFYIYDDQNRLKYIKDQEGNILESYKYNYRKE